ncbi:MAG: hypothetical protein KJO38_02730, partial [Gammaproteobacteria bacterium]|nr:hypothetical protein [Gammaproteobacteria bacterium]
MEAAVRPLYSDDLPYHNFGHVQDTVSAATDIVGRCAEEGIRVDPQVVYYALLFHDAGYQEDHARLGFDNKEAYSAHLATEYFTARGASTATIQKIVDAIMATHRDARFVTAEQKAVRAADLSGLAADYEKFRTNTINLWKEHAVLTGQQLSWADWVDDVGRVLKHYLAQEIRLTSYYKDNEGESAFH